ncbi:hypothetical protein ACFL4V_01820 [Candidatus Latescibacterota bacterium]
MTEITGTLWEHMSPTGSCNHGFASPVAHCLYRDVLGIYRVDTVNKHIVLLFTDVDLKWCDGRIPVHDGFVTLRWRRDDETLSYHIDVPEGYSVNIVNNSGLQTLQF